MNIYEKIKNREDFLVKFDDAPFNTDGGYNPGWLEPTTDEFFTRMTDKPVLLEQSTTYPMTALQHDLDMLMVDVELQSQRDTTGASTGLTNVETTPGFKRKVLTANPLQAKSIISDNFIEENIEGEDFLNLYMNQLAEAMGPAFERFGVFADKSVTTPTGEGSGLKMTNGILAQLKEIALDDNNPAHGFSKVVYKNEVGNGILDAIERYIDQEGNLDNATCVLPPQIYGQLMREIASDRNTSLGDAVYQDANMTKLMGITIVQDNVLRTTRNGYGTMKFTGSGTNKGELAATGGADVNNLKYGFITKPENIVFGMMRNIKTINQWDIDVLGYKVALLVKGDVSVLWDQDTLAIPFTMNTKSS